MSDHWDLARYLREKRSFMETRQRFRMVSVHAGLMFGVTWAAGWGLSALLLRAGLVNMALRYALAFALSYIVFFVCVRVWADFMRRERSSGENFVDPGVPVFDGEGCFVVLIAFAAGMVLAVIFASIGGPAMLLEVAFEVVFAGTLIKRMGKVQMMGDWARLLWLKTLPFAACVLLVLVACAAWLQHRAPQANTVVQAYQQIWGHAKAR